MTSIIGIILTVIVLGIGAMQWRLARKAKSIEGQAVPELEPDIDQKLRERGRVLLYFYSPTCAPCRAMTPRVDQALARHDNLFKRDIAQSPALASRLGVMATPTLLLLADGHIAQVIVGGLSKENLEALLA